MFLNFVLGTAAELIKVQPIIMTAIKKAYPVKIIATGQSHQNFLMQYEDFRLPPEILSFLFEDSKDLDHAKSAMKWFTRAALISSRQFESLLCGGSHKDTFVIVHGDTLSTLIASWLSWKTGVQAIHIEAGLRSPQLFNPFPEEISRRIVSYLVQVHMAPDKSALENLKRGHNQREVYCTNGNTLMDAIRYNEPSVTPGERFALINIHRFENLNSPTRWKMIVEILLQAAHKINTIFVTHPQMRHKLDEDPTSHQRLLAAGIDIRNRMPFSEFIGLLKNSEFLISDGGSNQEECSYLGKPCLLLREATERTEGLNENCVLSRFDQKIIADFLENPQQFERSPSSEMHSPSKFILEILEKKISL